MDCVGRKQMKDERKNDMEGKKDSILKILKIAVVTEAWMLTVNGSIWNESMLVWPMVFVIGYLIMETGTHLPEKRFPLLVSIAAGIVWTALFALGIFWGKIGGETPVSRVGIKCVLVFLGSTVQFLIWKRCFRRCRKGMSPVYGILWLVFTLAAFGLQGIIPWFSLAGWSMGVWVFLFWLVRADRHPISGFSRQIAVKIILSALFALFCTFGEWTSLGIRLGLTSSFLRLIACLFLLAIPWFFIFYAGLTAAAELPGRVDFFAKGCGNLCAGKRNGRRIVYMLGIWLAWLPYFLCWYPGVLSHDSVTQMEQVMGTAAYSDHHPWLHTLLIQLCVKIGMQWGDVNTGVAVYSVFSMCLLAFACARALVYLEQRGVLRRVTFVLWLFFACFPIHAVYAVTMWKDVIFAAVVLLFSVQLDVWLQDMEKKRNVSFLNWLLLGLLSVGVCLLRSNGYYAWLFTLPFWFAAILRKKRVLSGLFKKYLLSFGCMVMGVLSLCSVYKGVIFPAFQVEKPDLIESLSIPVQQIGCVLANDGEVTEKEWILLNKVVDTQRVAQVYTEYISDPIKYAVRAKDEQDYLRENMGEYVRCYVNIGIRNPGLYLRGFLEQTKGYWYHKVNNWIYYPDGVRENELGIMRTPKLPQAACAAIERLLGLTERLFHRFFSIAMITWILLAGLGLTWIKRERGLLYVLPMGIVLTLLVATPVCAEFRYIYAIFLVVPILSVLALAGPGTRGE